MGRRANPELTVRVHAGNHGYASIKFQGRWVYQHRYIWEQVNGPIPEGFDIHHKDGNKVHNEIENLELLPHAGHVSLHMKKDVSEAKTSWVKTEFSDEGRWDASSNAKRSATLAGHEVTTETRAKMSKSQMGKTIPPEVTAKRLATLKRNRELKKQNQT